MDISRGEHNRDAEKYFTNLQFWHNIVDANKALYIIKQLQIERRIKEGAIEIMIILSKPTAIFIN